MSRERHVLHCAGLLVLLGGRRTASLASLITDLLAAGTSGRLELGLGGSGGGEEHKPLGGKGGTGEHSNVSVSSEGRLLLGVLSVLECNGCAFLGGKDGGSISSSSSSVGRSSSLGLGGRDGIVSLLLLFRSSFIT